MTRSGDRSSIPGVTIERATLTDAETFIAIHEETARWLWERGIHQWEPGTFQHEWIVAPIERGEVYLAKRDGEVVGTVLIAWSDEHVWPDMPEDAGYIHGLRVRRSAAGQGLGLALLRWAEDAIRHAGKPSARLDCFANNATLRAYYERAGYAPRGEVTLEGYVLARFEKQVGGR